MKPRVLMLPVLVDGRAKLFPAFVCDDYSELSESDMRDVKPGMLAATYSQWRRSWLSFLWSRAQPLLRLDRLTDLIEWLQELPWLFRSKPHRA